MKSPFPGMDPYIENPAIWRDFHQRFATFISVQLNPQLEPRYIAQLEPRVEVGIIDGGGPRVTLPDVGVSEAGRGTPAGAGTAIMTPGAIELAVPLREEMTVVSVRIHRVEDLRLVTVIEILSPINKRAGNNARDEYIAKRADILESGVHLVEIDLLRRGEHMPLLPTSPDSAYLVMLSRADTRPRCEVWPLDMMDPLPVVPVPLRIPDPDAALNLAEAFAICYETGAYHLSIDYGELPPGPLSEEQQKWIGQNIKGV